MGGRTEELFFAPPLLLRRSNIQRLLLARRVRGCVAEWRAWGYEVNQKESTDSLGGFGFGHRGGGSS